LSPYTTLFRSDRAAHEQGVPVLPLVRLAVEGPRRRRHREVGHRRTRGGETQLRVSREVPDHRDDGVTCHGQLLRVCRLRRRVRARTPLDRKSTRLNSSHVKITYAVFCLQKKTIKKTYIT